MGDCSGLIAGQGRILRRGAGHVHPPPPEMQLSNITSGIPPPKKNVVSSPADCHWQVNTYTLFDCLRYNTRELFFELRSIFAVSKGMQ